MRNKRISEFVLLRLECNKRCFVAVKKFAELRDGQPAIYVSNVKPETLGTLYDDRIASRVLCGSWYELVGDDRRMK